jgi:hypothetical protein
MAFRKRLGWLLTLAASIVALPFVLVAFIISMTALGIYWISRVAFLPAFVLYGLAAMANKSAEKEYLSNPIIVISDWFLNRSEWKSNDRKTSPEPVPEPVPPVPPMMQDPMMSGFGIPGMGMPGMDMPGMDMPDSTLAEQPQPEI